MLSSTTQEFAARGGELYYFSVTGHNGHTTKIQIQDELGWHDVVDDNGDIEHTTEHMGSLRMPFKGQMRVHVDGGSGDLCMVFTGVTRP
jgi:hypothetical protein